MENIGKFIVLEGIDGSGKSTQVRRLSEALTKRGINHIKTREQTDMEIGRMIKDALTKKTELSQEALAHLFAADREMHVKNVILPALRRGECVLCDRHVFSNLAYQGLSMPMDQVLTLNSRVLEQIVPDLTIFIDVFVETSLKRINKRKKDAELFEDSDKLKGVAENFQRAFLMIPSAKVCKIDGNRCEDEVFKDVLDAVLKMIK